MKSVFYFLTILFLSLLLACSEEPPTNAELESLSKKPIKNPPTPLNLEHSLNQIVGGSGERSIRKYKGAIRVWTNYVNTWTRECNGTINAVAISDIDGDGYDELIAIKSYITGKGNGRLYHTDLQIWEDGDSDTPTAAVELIGPEKESSKRMAIGDVDNFAGDEIVITAGTNIQIWRYDGVEEELVKDNWEIALPPILTSIHVTIGDVDNNGDNEILVASASSNSNMTYNYLEVYDFGNGGPTHTIHFPFGEHPYDMEVADVDGDFANELILEGGSTFYVWEFDNGSFTQTESEYLGGKAVSPVVADFDGVPENGNEIVVGSALAGANKLQVFRYTDNEGSRSLEKIDEELTDDGIYNIFAGDADNDGDIEFVVGNFNGILVYNYNSGEFELEYSDNFDEWVLGIYVK